MTPQQFNAYVSWVVYAVVGKTREADALLQAHRTDVVLGALAQRAAAPVDLSATPLYRGILLEPEAIENGSLAADVRLQSLSFTEDVACAQYFADPNSDISSLVRQMRPRAEGYVIEHRAAPEDTLLFHHSWTHIVLPERYQKKIHSLPLAPLAKVQVGEALAAQLRWHLRAQREVILLQRGEALSVKPRSAYPSPTTRDLNERFTPPNVEMP